MLTSSSGIFKIDLKDKADATRSGHRGSNCLHSFTSPGSTGTRLSITGLRLRWGIPKTCLTYRI